MKIVIVGAGAIGMVMGSYLCRAGNEVEVMRMKGQHGNRMKGKGKAGGQGGGQCDCDGQGSGKGQRQRNRKRNQSSGEYCGNKETTPEAQPESSSDHKED